MKNKFLKSLIMVFALMPCLFLFVACGNLKSLEDKTLVFAKVEVTGSLSADDLEAEYSSTTFVFGENTVEFSGDSKVTYNYKLVDDVLYLKSLDVGDYGDAYGKLSGKYLVITETYKGETVKIYFKEK